MMPLYHNTIGTTGISINRGISILMAVLVDMHRIATIAAAAAASTFCFRWQYVDETGAFPPTAGLL